MRRALAFVVAGIAMLTVGLPSLNAVPSQPGPIDVRGEINGAPFRIVVPAVWNGTLLVYQRAYVDKADHPGEVDNRVANLLSPNPLLRDALRAQGYALAGSGRTGWTVEEGLADNVAIVSAARAAYRTKHWAEKRFDSMGSADHSLIWLKCQNCHDPIG